MNLASSHDAALALRSLSGVLAEANEPQLASSFRKMATRLGAAQTAEDRRSVITEALGYFRGMSSLNDLVVMQNGKPDVATNRRLDDHRTRVYEQLVQEL